MKVYTKVERVVVEVEERSLNREQLEAALRTALIGAKTRNFRQAEDIVAIAYGTNNESGVSAEYAIERLRTAQENINVLIEMLTKPEAR